MITLAHLYPREMNIYGDTGNVRGAAPSGWPGAGSRRGSCRSTSVTRCRPTTDILLGGGGQDAAQGELADDFLAKGPDLRRDGRRRRRHADDLRHLPAARARVHHPGRAAHPGRRRARRDHPGQPHPADRHQRRRDSRHDRRRPPGRLREPQRDDRTRRRACVRSGRAATGVRQQRHATAPRARSATTSSAPTCTGRCWPRAPRFADDLLRRALRRRGQSDELEPLDDALADQAAAVAAGRPR